jgi:hypothetical protein
LIRELAGFDPARFDAVMEWPLREMFLAYIDRLKDEALKRYQFDVSVWAALAPHKKKQTQPPDVPAILRS